MPQSDLGAIGQSAANIVRYDLPSPALRPYVSAYCTIYMTSSDEQVQWFLPGPATLALLIGAGPVEVLTLAAKYQAIQSISIINPTTRATRWVLRGGVITLVEFTPLGWLRLSTAKASRIADTVHAFDVAGCLSDAMVALARVLASGSASDISSVLDGVVCSLLGKPLTQPKELQLVAAALSAGGTVAIKDLTHDLAVDQQRLSRITKKMFGSSTKLIMRMIRFMRALDDYAHLTDLALCVDKYHYHDKSHLLRDSMDFVYATPRRFLKDNNPFLLNRLNARRAVTGIASAILDTSWQQLDLARMNASERE